MLATQVRVIEFTLTTDPADKPLSDDCCWSQ